MFDKKEYDKQHYKDNKKKVAKHNKQYRKDNPEYFKQYQEDHKEETAKRSRQWQKDNPEKCRICSNKFIQTPRGRFSLYKRNAKQRGLILGITLDEFVKITKKPCHYCGGEGYGIDRLDNTIGYLKDNVVSCCSMCNYMKSVYSEGDFINQCVKISTYWKKRK